MNQRLFRLNGVATRDPAIEAWLDTIPADLAGLVGHWLGALRSSGDDVRETMHDGRPTVCVGDVAFAYVDAFTAHVNVGFFHGSELPDPHGILEGTGKYMRHVKLRPEQEVSVPALELLVESAYADVRKRLTR